MASDASDVIDVCLLQVVCLLLSMPHALKNRSWLSELEHLLFYDCQAAGMIVMCLFWFAVQIYFHSCLFIITLTTIGWLFKCSTAVNNATDI